MQVKSIAEYLHLATICHLDLCMSIFEWPFYTGFTVNVNGQEMRLSHTAYQPTEPREKVTEH